MAEGEQKQQADQPWFLQSRFPVLFPTHPALFYSPDEFDEFLQNSARATTAEDDEQEGAKEAESVPTDDGKDASTASSEGVAAATEKQLSLSTEVRDYLENMELSDDEEAWNYGGNSRFKSKNLFVEGLLAAKVQKKELDARENMMRTENGDPAFESTLNPLVDLFSELEDVMSPGLMRERLDAAWADDRLATLKIIFNSRSIHLGKSSRSTFYRAAGWLYKRYPLTLISNLRWLSRPVIMKKVEKKDAGAEEQAVLVEITDVDENDPRHYDVRNGVAHGYWKDLLNLIVLDAKGVLDETVRGDKILHWDERKDPKVSAVDKDTAMVKRREVRDGRHTSVTKLFEKNATYRALHITVARLFAEQLQLDIAALRGDDARAKKQISLCAKWAPSTARFHDKHTFIVSSIAEILYPASGFDITDRETYLRHAREAYRKDVSALRAHLDIVERKITTQKVDTIRYDRIPSLAMQTYAPLFIKKDSDRFEKYIDNVADGKAQISGATLLPSKMVALMMEASRRRGNSSNLKGKLAERMAEMQAKVADGQWNALVQRIKDSGTLENCIAICDVSGSMTGPTFPDGTNPMHAAIGLSLLMAEVTQAPFGGHFITFSENPQVQTIDLEASFRDKISSLQRAAWGMNTDFAAVFERLILPMAVKNKLKKSEMVRRVFVFSDMQFDSAQQIHGSDKWSTSFERIQKKYEEAGYDMPEMVFWNLAGGRAGYDINATQGWDAGEATPPKPVKAEEPGTALVSGYSQAMLKVFLDSGTFEEPADGEEDVEVVEASDEDEDEDGGTVRVNKRQKMDPVAIMKKSIGHKAYEMLKVHEVEDKQPAPRKAQVSSRGGAVTRGRGGMALRMRGRGRR